MTSHAASPASTEIKEGAESRGRRARATRSRRIGRLCFATISLWLQKAKRAEDRQRQAERAETGRDGLRAFLDVVRKAHTPVIREQEQIRKRIEYAFLVVTGRRR